jgi:hypothetical protein
MDIMGSWWLHMLSTRFSGVWGLYCVGFLCSGLRVSRFKSQANKEKLAACYSSARRKPGQVLYFKSEAA